MHASEKIGLYRDEMKDKGWEYKMHVTFIEIYNEQVFCLLREEGSDKLDLSIKQDKKGKTFVDGANKLEIDPTDLKVGANAHCLWFWHCILVGAG